MFTILQLEDGTFIIQNFLGGFVNDNGHIKIFKTYAKAEKEIKKFNNHMSQFLNRLEKSYVDNHNS